MHRIGIHSYTSGLHLVGDGLRPGRGRRRDPRPRCRSPRRSSGARRRVLLRAIPLLEGDAIVGVLVLAARRHRPAPPRPPAAVEGRDDPRDPPPGEEQPADDRRAAPAAGPPAAVARGAGRDRGVGAAHPLDRDRARDAVARRGDVVRFDDIVQPLVRVVEETVADARHRPAASRSIGDAGLLPGDLATPLAVVLNELMQNAVDHAFPRVSTAAPAVKSGCSSPRRRRARRRRRRRRRRAPARLHDRAVRRARPLDRADAGDERARRHDRAAGDHGTRCTSPIPLRKAGTASL